LYLRLTEKLYRFLSRRTDSKFNKIVLKRLHGSRVNKAPVSLSKLVRYSEKAKVAQKGKDLVFAVVGTITNDIRQLEIGALNVCALRFTEKARERIVAAGRKWKAPG
jgi:large subunit ribosomal protein L18e